MKRKRIDYRNTCRGCGKLTSYVYCADCIKSVKCPHGQELGNCKDCDVESDLAYDSNRGGR